MAKLHTFAILTTASLASFISFAAIPVRWSTDAYRVKPLVYDCYHGETLDMAASLTAYGSPLDLAGKTAKLYWQTNGMDAAWWSTNGEVRVESGATNVLAAIWSGAFDTGSDEVSGFIGVEGENYRAAFTLRFRPSPGFNPSVLPTPTKTINWAAVVNENVNEAPFVVKGGEGGVTLVQVTNVANYQISDKVADWAMKPNQPPKSGVDTNTVKSIIESEVGGTNTLVHTGAISDMETKTHAANTYQVKGNYLTAHQSLEPATNYTDSVASGKQDTLTDYTTTNAVRAIVSDFGSTNYLALKGGGTLTDPNDEYGVNVITLGFGGVGPHIEVAQGAIKTEIDSTSITIEGVDVMDEISSKLSSSVADSTSVYSTNILSLARAGSGSIATNVVADKVGGISNKLEYIEGYMAGQRVRISVTNYYGNTSGELPRLRIEEYITATNVVDGVDVETNYWQMVWDENNKYQQFYTNTTIAVSCMTNDLYQTYYALLQERLNTKAPRAWGTLTSAGEAAPVGTVWHTEPNTVFAGGTEYAHAMVGSGVIGVLTSRGAAIYTDGETGRFHFTTDDRQYYFGMNVASRYELGCDTDGITVTQVASNNIVQLLYNVTMSGKPILYYKPTLTNAWSQITDSTGAAVPGAPVYASWDQAPPAGSEICTINGGRSLSGFFKAGIEYAGSSKFETNMMADLAGGVLATNQTTNQMQPIEPYISNGQVLWRIKQ